MPSGLPAGEAMTHPARDTAARVLVRMPRRGTRVPPSGEWCDAERARDRDLVERARDGDREAFRRLVSSHQDRLYALALRLSGSRPDAEDLAQETLLRVHEGLGRFRGDCVFWVWVRTICANLHRNRANHRSRVRSEPFVDVADPARDVGDELDAKRERELVDWGIRRLSPDLREVLVFRHAEQMSYEEIAAMMDLPIGTVRSRLHRARACLSRILAPHLR